MPAKTKPRVTGIGGIFFKAKDPKKLRDWYREHLGLPLDPAWGGWSFEWREVRSPKKKGCTVWSAFENEGKSFGSARQKFMINYRVANLAGLLKQLKQAGVWVDPKVEENEYGKFGWARDAEGNRIELWEPPK